MSRTLPIALCGVLSILLSTSTASASQEAAKPAESPAPEKKEISPEAKKLLPVLEPFKSELEPCQALQAEALALLKKADSPEFEGWQEKTKEGKKRHEAFGKLMVAANQKSEATTNCFDALKSKAVPGLKAASPSDAVSQEAWSYWLASNATPKPAESPKP
jgi:hypothetical protein